MSPFNWASTHTKSRLLRLFGERLGEVVIKNATMALAYLLGLIVIALFIAGSFYLTRLQSVREQEDLAARLAKDAVQRTDSNRIYTFKAFKALEDANDPDPCSDANVAIMRRFSMGSSQVVNVGYIANDRLMCSSYGRHGLGIPVGPPTYLSPSGAFLRLLVELPFAPDTKFVTTTHQSSGYTCMMLSDWTTSDFSEIPNAKISVGTFAFHSQKPLFTRGTLDSYWMERLGNSNEVSWFDGRAIVALKRSPYDYVGYAVIPASEMKRAWRETAMLTAPLGLFMGFVLSLLVFRITKRQFSAQTFLKSGLKNNELFLLYQPVIELTSGRWVGAEALLRWRRPNGTMIPPDIFIPVAEQFNMARQVTDRVIELFVRDARELLRHHPDFHIALNLSAVDFQDEGIASIFATMLSESGIRACNVLIEATERIFMNVETTRKNVHELRSMGIRIAIDDFGTGYSSLSYLMSLELDGLKIDKSFVDTIGTESATSHVVDHIIEMAKSLKLTMVAEGVETQQQADYLLDRGVQFAQGWLFSKPMGIAELEASLPKHGAVDSMNNANASVAKLE